jgi:hypothetical protein
MKSITKIDHPLHSPDLALGDFWLIKCPEGTIAAIPDIQHNMTTRYSGTRFSRLFPAVAPSSHKVHSFIRRVF